MVLLDHGGRDARELDILAPPTDLSGVIEHLWVENRTDMSVADWRVVPDTSPYLIAMVTACAQKRTIRIVVVGARSRSDSAKAMTVAELACHLRTPTRSLRERTHREVGLSPKRMLRVLRLHAALHAARRPGRSWSDVAYVAGYADQAHLSRELRALLGETPSAWKVRGSADSFKTSGSGVR